MPVEKTGLVWTEPVSYAGEMSGNPYLPDSPMAMMLQVGLIADHLRLRRSLHRSADLTRSSAPSPQMCWQKLRALRSSVPRPTPGCGD